MPVPWWLLVGEGAAAIAVALLLLTRAGVDHLLTLLVLLALYWLMGGVMELVDLLADTRRWAWKLLGAAAGIAAGLMVLRHPLWSTLLVPAVLAEGLGGFAIAVGAIRLVRALLGGGPGLAALGVLSLTLGLVLLIASPRVMVWTAALGAAVGGTAVLAIGHHHRSVEAVARARQRRPAG